MPYIKKEELKFIDKYITWLCEKVPIKNLSYQEADEEMTRYRQYCLIMTNLNKQGKK